MVYNKVSHARHGSMDTSAGYNLFQKALIICMTSFVLGLVVLRVHQGSDHMTRGSVHIGASYHSESNLL